MKKNIVKLIVASWVVLLNFMFPISGTYAEETPIPGRISIGLTPTSKILQIVSDAVYDDFFTVKNDGDSTTRIEVYAAPYSYAYSNEEDLYRLGFANENNFTQISRWISFKDDDGNYVEKALFSIEPESALEVAFRITTPANIPSGGQYAVIFARTLSTSTAGGGIRTEASPGIVVYGRSSEGEIVVSSEISELGVEQRNIDGRSSIFASAKVKNIGNVDFTATGALKVEQIIGFGSHESSATSEQLLIIPEAELIISSAWTEAPSFGLYRATWTVTVGARTETIEKVIFIISPFVIIATITALTIIVTSAIVIVRRRKERRSRFSA